MAPAVGDGIRPDATDLLRRLRDGDEDAFCALVDRHAASMLRVARLYVPSRAVAEEVVQETWLAVLSGLEGFEGRSSLKTWLFGILINRARTRGRRERRAVPFATLAAREGASAEPAGTPDPFQAARADLRRGHWGAPERCEDSPERALQSREASRVVREAVRELAPMQRLVVTMRDLEGWTSDDVCEALHISATNQRVLLHRGRVHLRVALEAHLAPAPPPVRTTPAATLGPLRVAREAVRELAPMQRLV